MEESQRSLSRLTKGWLLGGLLQKIPCAYDVASCSALWSRECTSHTGLNVPYFYVV